MTTRSMIAADIARGLALCRLNGWNQLQQDWELFLHESPNGCRVAVTDSMEVIGTAATIRYDQFSWIGMVLVDPAHQRQGIGQRLLLEVLDILKNEPTVRLDATPAGRNVYTKLGFTDEFELSRMHVGVAPRFSSSSDVRHFRQNDLQSLVKLDGEVFGSDRRSVLEWMIRNSPELAFVSESKDGISGFTLGRRGHRFTQIGPAVANESGQAIALVRAALTQCNGEVILDVTHGGKLQEWLFQHGFTEMRRLIRMQRGKQFRGGDPQRQFAILGPELG